MIFWVLRHSDLKCNLQANPLARAALEDMSLGWIARQSLLSVTSKEDKMSEWLFWLGNFLLGLERKTELYQSQTHFKASENTKKNLKSKPTCT